MIDTKAGCCFGTALCNCDNLTERKFRLWIFTVLCLCSRTGGRSVWRTSPPWPVCSGRAGLRLFAPVPMRAVPSSEHWRAERWDAGNSVLIFIIFAETEELFDEEYKFYMQNENKSMQTIISSCCSSCMNDTAAIFIFFFASTRQQMCAGVCSAQRQKSTSFYTEWPWPEAVSTDTSSASTWCPNTSEWNLLSWKRFSFFFVTLFTSDAPTKPYLFIQLLHIELRWTSKWT